MPVEFLGIAAINDGSEITARSGPVFDKGYTLRLARAHEENGWDDMVARIEARVQASRSTVREEVAKRDAVAGTA
jgi:hypothetical protein